jgi:D-lyxose ketol-isomerase
VKRSDINSLIRETIKLINEMNFRLPPRGYGFPDNWRNAGMGRFPEITEDEKPAYLLVNDYKTFL